MSGQDEMSDGELDFPAAPLSPSLPSDFQDMESELASASTSHMPSVSATELRAKMNNWIERARAKKHESDKAAQERRHRIAAVLAIDALVCFMTGFDYEDRGDAVKRQAAHPLTPLKVCPGRSWASLLPFLEKLAGSTKSVDVDLAGMCSQVLAVVRIQVACGEKHSSSPTESAKLLFSAISDFQTGLRLLPLEVLKTRYHLGSWTEKRVNVDRINPLSDQAALPLHVNTTLAECAAFTLRIGRLWAQQEHIEYSWEAERYDT